jgi:hypothetical protein
MRPCNAQFPSKFGHYARDISVSGDREIEPSLGHQRVQAIVI